jgi:SNF2 family DNA or RNA helicase
MNIVEFEMSYNQFCSEYYYVRPLEKGIYTIPILIAPKTFKLGELMSRIGKHSLTKKAIDCIDLPEKRTTIHKINGMNTSKYKELEKGIFDVRDELRTMIKLEAINKTHQAANGFVYSMGRVVNKLCENKKLNKLLDLVTNYLEETDKIIIVYYYQEDLCQLQLALTDYSVTTDIDKFTKDSQILLLQFGQAEGLNLQFCNKMIFYTYDYSFLKFDQMCGRIYRSGQKNKVTYDILINTETIEDKI